MTIWVLSWIYSRKCPADQYEILYQSNVGIIPLQDQVNPEDAMDGKVAKNTIMRQEA